MANKFHSRVYFVTGGCVCLCHPCAVYVTGVSLCLHVSVSVDLYQYVSACISLCLPMPSLWPSCAAISVCWSVGVLAAGVRWFLAALRAAPCYTCSTRRAGRSFGAARVGQRAAPQRAPRSPPTLPDGAQRSPSPLHHRSQRHRHRCPAAINAAAAANTAKYSSLQTFVFKKF